MVWSDFVVAEPDKWGIWVNTLFFTESILDPSAEPSSVSVRGFVCEECNGRPSFASTKALLQHKRMIHGYRDDVCEYIDGSGVCLACQTNNNSRWRCLAHVCDTRRQACRTVIINGNILAIHPNRLQRLECIDREARKPAIKAGHTHPIAMG